MENIPFLGIIIAILVSQFIGALWYSPRFFGKAWAHAHHFDMSKMKPLPMHYIGAFIVGIVLVVCIAAIHIMLGIASMETALVLGFLMWLGFVATSHFSGVVWAKKPLTVFMIDTGYFLVITLLTSAIIVSFR
jgi:hypothetical protein